jgi:hypothetical protein
MDVSVRIARRHSPTVQERQQFLAPGGNIVDMYVRPAPVCCVLESRQNSKGACSNV